jgi:hypothetical protein
MKISCMCTFKWGTSTSTSYNFFHYGCLNMIEERNFCLENLKQTLLTRRLFSR